MAARRLAAILMGAALAASLVLHAQTPPPEFRPLSEPVQRFVDYMAATHAFERSALHDLFAQLKPSAGVQKAIAAPSTARPWHEFRPLFVDRSRIDNGVKFWDAHAPLLARAQEEFGIPAAVIVAIVGVETRYGRVTGSFRTLDALHTLAFEGTNRPEFFRSELEHFLLLTREQRWSATDIKGSYAGAMGWPQFMPSSYRRYSIDYDGDGRVDLWSSAADVVGSVASYLAQFGWRVGEPFAVRARFDGDPEQMPALGTEPAFNVGQWRMRGVQAADDVPAQLDAGLFRLDLADGPEYWLGFGNFYAVLHYNRSRHYAMAVWELAQEISAAREQPL
ncbi:MAG: lytic murein transglycosylase B [Burkholderiales bacterium]|nr:lytic murein transglycosylase B [Burkholderiales bacterium]